MTNKGTGWLRGKEEGRAEVIEALKQEVELIRGVNANSGSIVVLNNSIERLEGEYASRSFASVSSQERLLERERCVKALEKEADILHKIWIGNDEPVAGASDMDAGRVTGMRMAIDVIKGLK